MGYEKRVEITEGETGDEALLIARNQSLYTFPGRWKKWAPSPYFTQTKYSLIVNGRPVGLGKLRHYLNDDLIKHGGHIGYTIRPSERGKGYGNLILKELLKKASEKGIREVLVICRESNVYSRKVIENNGGYLENVTDEQCRYWIREL